MAGKLMYIPNDDTPNYPSYYKKWLKCLDTQLNKPTNQNAIKVPIVGKLGNKKPALSPSLPGFSYLQSGIVSVPRNHGYTKISLT